MPLTNENIAEFKKLLTEIRDRLPPNVIRPENTHAVVVKDPSGNIIEAVMPDEYMKPAVEKPKHKGGRPKGSKNVKRISKRKHRVDQQVQ